MFQVYLLFTLLLLSLLVAVEPLGDLIRRQRGGASPTFQINSKAAKFQARLAQRKGEVGQSKDGTTILPMTAVIGKFALQFKIAAANEDLQPKAKPGQVVQAGEELTGVPGGKGINLLLHGDGGQSFFDFPNQRLQNDLLGVVALAPNDKMFWGGGAGGKRTDGALHSQLVDDLVLPQVLKMDPNKTFFMGISGGSLLLSGFFMPTFAEKYNTGVIFGCGALPPQVQVSPNFGQTLGKMRMHFQATTEELDNLQPSIEKGIVSYLESAKKAGVPNEVLGKKVTADATPKGKHCAFDGKGFVSGIQLLADNYGNIIFGDGEAQGIENVAKSALENTQTFSSGLPLAKVQAQGQRRTRGRSAKLRR